MSRAVIAYLRQNHLALIAIFLIGAGGACQFGGSAVVGP